MAWIVSQVNVGVSWSYDKGQKRLCKVTYHHNTCLVPSCGSRVNVATFTNSVFLVWMTQTRWKPTFLSVSDSQWPVYRLGQVLGSISRNMTPFVQRFYVLVVLLVAESQLAVSDSYECSTPVRLIRDSIAVQSMIDLQCTLYRRWKSVNWAFWSVLNSAQYVITYHYSMVELQVTGPRWSTDDRDPLCSRPGSRKHSWGWVTTGWQ